MAPTPTEEEILQDLQRNGDNVPSNIAENIGRAPKYVTRVMPDLVDMGLVENKGRGVYTLTPDGREFVRSGGQD